METADEDEARLDGECKEEGPEGSVTQGSRRWVGLAGSVDVVGPLVATVQVG